MHTDKGQGSTSACGGKQARGSAPRYVGSCSAERYQKETIERSKSSSECKWNCYPE